MYKISTFTSVQKEKTMNFKPGQLVRRTKLSTASFVTPIVPLGGVVRVTENFPSRNVMTVVLLADYGNGWEQGDEITVNRDHYIPVVKLSKRKPINEN